MGRPPAEAVLPLPLQLLDGLRRARHVVVLTGAGISAESGIPTFRDALTGLWARFRPEELATPDAFVRDPDLVWQWYQWRREQIAAARPNAGHLALAALERLVPRLTLVTQNVDGLHQQAGSRQVVEFHGNIHRNRCSMDQELVDVDVRGTRRPPRCPRCGGMVRPDVVWFGEPIPRACLVQSQSAVARCDLFVSVGTSALVEPAAGLARLAREAGAVIVEINPAETPLTSSADYALQGAAGQLLPALAAALA
ncbi:MAG: NAD-dependent deacylase [Gammaproteobacteria bacterium]|nr:NAD-dependent deacylase [Gammaproteobacteria bacterium]